MDSVKGCVDSVWILCGFCADSVDSVRILYGFFEFCGFCIGSALILY